MGSSPSQFPVAPPGFRHKISFTVSGSGALVASEKKKKNRYPSGNLGNLGDHGQLIRKSFDVKNISNTINML